MLMFISVHSVLLCVSGLMFFVDRIVFILFQYSGDIEFWCWPSSHFSIHPTVLDRVWCVNT